MGVLLIYIYILPIFIAFLVLEWKQLSLSDVAIWMLGAAFVLWLAIFWGPTTNNYSIFSDEYTLTFLPNAVFGLTLVGLLFLILGQKSKRTVPLDTRTKNRRLRVIAWMLTLLFTTSLILFLALLAVPYFGSPKGLDPRSWPPFAWEGFGLSLYEAAYTVWFLVGLLLLPLVAMQFSVLKRIWLYLKNVERTTHATFVGASIVVSLFTVTFGQFILNWLID